jgi:hypothetical protein
MVCNIKSAYLSTVIEDNAFVLNIYPKFLELSRDSLELDSMIIVSNMGHVFYGNQSGIAS